MKNLLLKNWKEKGLKPYSQTNNKDFYKVFYNHKTEPYSTLSESRIKQIRQDNQNFLSIMQGLNKKGIVTMDIDGWGDAGGHTTLWNGSKFLDDTNYLNDKTFEVFVRELCFFEL
ncbi:T6SS effector amidase Tae4 family protein [Helicobacter ganmani]|uniref:T6SS effector amidase Tae4 family protein n=1 Tax=Helicobacter ganmani TaxID=60246 RepID=UPI003A87F6C6